VRTILYFIRHGETEWNVEGRLQGQTDAPLNATGRRQAAACGKILGDLIARDGRPLSHDAWVASPLSRARETMELMLGAMPAPSLGQRLYRTDDRLKELTFGSWEGFTLAEIGARHPDLLAARERDKWRFVPPGGESYEQLCARVREWHGTLDRDTVAVAHGGILRVLLVILGVAPPETAPSEGVAQGAVYRFADGRMACYQ
jgi:broad specificity phosphatase PhoE